ncbi:MAG: DUF6529 family protein [Blastococcus sp.]
MPPGPAWLATAVLLLVVVQVLTALWMWRRLPGVGRPPAWLAGAPVERQRRLRAPVTAAASTRPPERSDTAPPPARCREWRSSSGPER